MENVPVTATRQHNSALSELIEGFQDASYAVRIQPKILNATNCAVPRDRRRLFLMGAKRGTGMPDYPAPTTMLGLQARPRERDDEGNHSG